MFTGIPSSYEPKPKREYDGYDPAGNLIMENWIEKKYISYGFMCPDISKLRLDWEKERLYNKILNQFKKELKELIYK